MILALSGGVKLALSVVAALCIAAIGALSVWRTSDIHADRKEAARLLALQPNAPSVFDPSTLADLPEPARRYLTWAIKPGTPLLTVARVSMKGRFRMGTVQQSTDFAMSAWQVLAPPEGFVWSMRARRGHLAISGSDSGRWSRFWALGLIPVARGGLTEDFRRSAFGRGIGEAAFWAPAAMMPGPGVTWATAGADIARVTVEHERLTQSVDLKLNKEGRPREVVFSRWSNANPAGAYQVQSFGGTLSDFRWVDGFRVPHRVEAGNFFGTSDYFPFYEGEVTLISWPLQAAIGVTSSRERNGRSGE